MEGARDEGGKRPGRREGGVPGGREGGGPGGREGGGPGGRRPGRRPQGRGAREGARSWAPGGAGEKEPEIIFKILHRQAAALLGGARSVGELRSGALPATPRGAASTAGGGGPAPRMAWSRTQKYLSPQQGLGGGANQGTTPRGDGRAGGGGGKSKEKARSAKKEVEVKRFRSLRSGAQRELRQRQAQSQQETLMHERIRVAEDRERHLHLQQQRSRREKENRRFFEELKRRGLEQTMQATRDREARRAQAQAQRSAMRNSAAVR